MIVTCCKRSPTPGIIDIAGPISAPWSVTTNRNATTSVVSIKVSEKCPYLVGPKPPLLYSATNHARSFEHNVDLVECSPTSHNFLRNMLIERMTDWQKKQLGASQPSCFAEIVRLRYVAGAYWTAVWSRLHVRLTVYWTLHPRILWTTNQCTAIIYELQVKLVHSHTVHVSQSTKCK